MSSLPQFRQVVETGIYVNDLEAAERFYCDILGLRRVSRQEGRDLFLAVGSNMLLVFYAPGTLSGEKLPAHGAQGPGHFALEVEDTVALERWRDHLQKHNVVIEKELEWGQPNLRSIYFRDPSGNSVEIIVRGVWPL